MFYYLPNQLDKNKKATFCKLKTSLSRNFICNSQKHFGDFVKCIFTILLQTQHENDFLPTNKHQQAKAREDKGDREGIPNTHPIP